MDDAEMRERSRLLNQAREKRNKLADTLFIVKRMELVPKILMINVLEFFLAFTYIAMLQFCKDDLSTKQYVVAWLALILFLWLFTKQIYGFFIGF